MEPEAKYFRVGAVVLILSGLIVFAVLWLSEATERSSTKLYTVYFAEQSLDGLQVDSVVTVKGIKVGRVRSFTIPLEDIERVRVNLELEADVPVKTDTEAVIKRNLLTGLATIDLIRSSQGSEPLVVIPEGEEHPVIPEGRSPSFSEVTESIPKFVENVGDLVARIKDFLSEENRLALQNTLANLEKFSLVLAKNDQEFNAIVQDLRVVAAQIREMSESFHRLTANTDRHIGEVSEELVGALSELQNSAKNLDRHMGDVAGAVKNGMDVIGVEAGNLAQSVGRAAEKISGAAEKLEDPKALIIGPAEEALGPGEKFR